MTFLVPFFIDEFHSLHDTGFIFVDRARISVASSDAGWHSRPEVYYQIADTLPDFLPDAEHSLLIACFTGSATAPRLAPTNDPLTSSKVCFCAKDCFSLIPLTRRARDILSNRLDQMVRLDEPVFEEIIEKRFADRDLLSSLAGASALAELLIENADSFDFIRLHCLATGEKHDFGLAGAALNYTRYKPLAGEPISGLLDLGKILKDTLPDSNELNPPLVRLSAWGKSRWETTVGFKKVYEGTEIQKILDEITATWSMPVSAHSLGIFLHWRYLSQKAQGLDLKALETDCRELAGSVSGQYIAEALWLLGYSAGFSSFAGNYYAAQETAHPFGAKRQALKRIRLSMCENLPSSTSQHADQCQVGRMKAVHPDGERGGGKTKSESPVHEARSDSDSNVNQLDKAIDQMPATPSQTSSESADTQHTESYEEEVRQKQLKTDPSLEPHNETKKQEAQSGVEPTLRGEDLNDSPQKKKAGSKGPKAAGARSKKAEKTAGDLFQTTGKPGKSA